MKGRHEDFLLGLTTIALVAIFLGTVLFLYPTLRAPAGRLITIRFWQEDGMAPISEGSPVMLSGSMRVGEVQKIVTERLPYRTARGEIERLAFLVTAKIDENLKLGGDCQITSDQPAVGGGGSIVILNVGNLNEPLVEPISGLPPQSLSAVISALSRRVVGPGGMLERLEDALDPEKPNSAYHKVLVSLKDINAITAELRTQLSPAEQQTLMYKLSAILDDINSATRALRDETSRADADSLVSKTSLAMDRLNESLSEAALLLRDNRPALTSAVAAADRTLQKVDAELIDKLVAELDRNNPESLLGKLHVSMNRVNATLADFLAIAATGREVVALNRPLIDRSILNFKEMSDQLRLASVEIRLAPWRLLFQPDEKERQKLGTFEAARTFAEAATYLDDAAARLQAISAATGSDGQPIASRDEIQRIQESLKAAFERFSRAENYLYEKLQK